MVKMVLGSSDGQANSVSSLASNRMAAFQSTMDALTNFIATTNLTGNAYENAQQYAQSTLIPLLQAAILYEENLSTAVGKIPSEYRNTEHLGEDLDSEELEEELQALDMTRSSLMESVRVSEQHDLNGSTLNSNGRNTQSLRGQLRTVNQRREKIMQQLAALAAYSATSVTFFDGLTEVPSDLKSALAMVSGDMSSFSGEFPERKDIGWVKKVSSEWARRNNEDVSKAYRSVQEKVKQGELSPEDLLIIYQYGEQDLDEKNLQNYLKWLTENSEKIKDVKGKVDIGNSLASGGNLAYLGSQIGIDVNGNFILNHPNSRVMAKLNEILDINSYYDHYRYSSGKPYSTLTTHHGSKPKVPYTELYDSLSLSTIKSGVDMNAVRSAAKNGFIDGFTLGTKGLKDVWRGASKAGKGFIAVNLISNVVDIGLGQVQSHKIATDTGIKAGSVSYVANQAAGLGVDMTKAAIATTAATAAGVVVTGVAAAFFAPAVATVAGVIGAGFVAYKVGSALDDVAEGAKKKIAKGIKSASDTISGWTKNLSNSFTKGVFS